MRRTNGKQRDEAWMLKKADAISGFVAEQRSRTQRAATNSAWGVAFKELSAESELLGKQVQQALQQAASRTPDLAPEVAELLQLHQEAAATEQDERLQVMAQVQDLSRLVHSMRCYGLPAIDNLEATLASLHQELNWLAQDIDSQLTSLGSVAEQLAHEIASDSKAALAAGSSSSGRSSQRCSCSCEEGSACASTAAGNATFITAAANGSDQPAAGSAYFVLSSTTHDAAADRDSSKPAADSNADDNGSTAATASSGASGAAATAAAVEDEELQQLLVKHPLAPDRLQQQVVEAYSAMCLQHTQQVQQLADTAGQQGISQAGKYGNWSADDHALFVRLRGLAFKSAGSSSSSSKGRGCSRSAVLERLGLMMPGKDRKQLEAHEAWYTASCLHQRRTTDLAAAWQRARSSFMLDSGRMLAEACAAAAAGAEAAATRLAWEAAGQVLHCQLDELQQAKRQQQQELAAQQEAQALAAAATAAAEQAAWQKQHAAKKAQVAEYKQRLQQQLVEAQQLAEQQAAAGRAAAEAAITAQQPAVLARQAERWDRLQQQLEQQKQRQTAFADRQARLAAIAEALAPKVPNDPQRVLQPTDSSAAAASAALEAAEDAATAAFRPVHGYTTAQVVADPRFRVVEALRQAGLMNGTAKGYVQQVVDRLQPATATRADNLTTGQLQAKQQGRC